MYNNQINGQPVSEEMLIKLGYRKYRGDKMTIFYAKDICEHIGIV